MTVNSLTKQHSFLFPWGSNHLRRRRGSTGCTFDWKRPGPVAAVGESCGNRQSRRNVRWLMASECIGKCLLVKLIINLATVSVSNCSVWVTLFPISTLLCTLACCRPHGAVNLYIDLPVCFPLLTPHSSFRWSVTSPPLSINPPFAICPKVSDAKCMTASLNPHFPPKWNLRTYKPKKKKKTLLGYAHSPSVSSIRPPGICCAPDWFLAFHWID